MQLLEHYLSKKIASFSSSDPEQDLVEKMQKTAYERVYNYIKEFGFLDFKTFLTNEIAQYNKEIFELEGGGSPVLVIGSYMHKDIFKNLLELYHHPKRIHKAIKEIKNPKKLLPKEITPRFDFTFETKPEEIVKWLSIGTKLPILKGFYKYILHDLSHFSTKSMFLTEHGNVAGHVLLYHENERILYFGFFGVVGDFSEDASEKIGMIVDKIIEYAKEHHFSIVRGPINIPTIIFGWGFQEEESKSGLYLAKPINLPIYQKVFQEKGFYIKIRELSLEGKLQRYDESMFSNYDFSDYEIFHPDSWEQLLACKPIFFQLAANNLPSQTQMTPGVEHLFENYVTFIKEYGELYMFAFLRHKPTNKIVGCFICIPNAIDLLVDKKVHSFIVFLAIVDREHQSKGIGNYFSVYVLNKGWENGIRFSSSPVNSKNQRIINLGAKLGHIPARSHIILEYSL